MIRNVILFIISMLLLGCIHKAGSESASNINIEMFGSWSNDSGCAATFAKVNNGIVLSQFTDGKANMLSDVSLISKKISIMTTFKAENTKVKFSGSFLEGVVIIDTYCTQPLHKIDK